MTFVQPITLRDRGVRLEPLALEHEEGLRAAAADGALWKLRITSVPEPQDTRAYIENARREACGNWLDLVPQKRAAQPRQHHLQTVDDGPRL